MANHRLIALNGNAGTFVNIVATIPARLIEMREDDAAPATGIQVQDLIDNFLTTNVYASTSEPVQIPNMLAWTLKGRLLGLPAQGQAGAFNARASDKLVSARGNAAGVTTLRFTEYE